MKRARSLVKSAISTLIRTFFTLISPISRVIGARSVDIRAFFAPERAISTLDHAVFVAKRVRSVEKRALFSMKRAPMSVEIA